MLSNASMSTRKRWTFPSLRTTFIVQGFTVVLAVRYSQLESDNYSIILFTSIQCCKITKLE